MRWYKKSYFLKGVTNGQMRFSSFDEKQGPRYPKKFNSNNLNIPGVEWHFR